MSDLRSPAGGSVIDLSGVEDAADRALAAPLSAAGYERVAGHGWSFRDHGVSVAVSVRAAEDSAGRPGVSVTFGWAFDTIGDPQPDLPAAESHVHRLPSADLGGGVGIGWDADEGLAGWERRFGVFVRKAVIPWCDRWVRPAGFRDFLARRELHLAAAWVSALLGHDERVDLEVRSATARMALRLGAGFDRHRAELDMALAAPMAARNGLGAFLAAAGARNPALAAAFESRRGDVARERVTEPGSDHARMVRRHDVYVALCLERAGRPR